MIKINFLLFLIVFSACVLAQDKLDIANNNRRSGPAKPSEFLQLPAEITNDLEKRGCTIPQPFSSTGKLNVIQGEFMKRGQKDWAVLCTIDQVSSILVFWNGSINGVSTIASAADSDFVENQGEDEIGYLRSIEIADAKYIDDHYKAYGGVKPPKIVHQGINDILAEKASTVLYFHKGKWLELQGAD